MVQNYFDIVFFRANETLAPELIISINVDNNDTVTAVDDDDDDDDDDDEDETKSPIWRPPTPPKATPPKLEAVQPPIFASLAAHDQYRTPTPPQLSSSLLATGNIFPPLTSRTDLNSTYELNEVSEVAAVEELPEIEKRIFQVPEEESKTAEVDINLDGSFEGPREAQSPEKSQNVTRKAPLETLVEAKVQLLNYPEAMGVDRITNKQTLAEENGPCVKSQDLKGILLSLHANYFGKSLLILIFKISF
jgi:hypothetical protein